MITVTYEPYKDYVGKDNVNNPNGKLVNHILRKEIDAEVNLPDCDNVRTNSDFCWIDFTSDISESDKNTYLDPIVFDHEGVDYNLLTTINNNHSPHEPDETIRNLFCESNNGAITVVLPASPESAQYQIRVFNSGTSGNNVTIDRNGNTINGQAVNGTITDGNNKVYIWDLNNNYVEI